MRRPILPLLLLASLPWVAAPASAQLVNGSFDAAAPASGVRVLSPGDPGLPGWEVLGGEVRWVAGTASDPADDGTAFVELVGGFLGQTFATTPGGWYRVDAVIKAPPGAGVSLLVNGVSVGILRSDYGPHPLWSQRAFRFFASGPFTTLEAGPAPGSTGIARLDHLRVTSMLRVTPTAAPTWGCLKEAYR